jgi:hypothetical protein
MLMMFDHIKNKILIASRIQVRANFNVNFLLLLIQTSIIRAHTTKLHVYRPLTKWLVHQIMFAERKSP